MGLRAERKTHQAGVVSQPHPQITLLTHYDRVGGILVKGSGYLHLHPSQNLEYFLYCTITPIFSTFLMLFLKINKLKKIILILKNSNNKQTSPSPVMGILFLPFPPHSMSLSPHKPHPGNGASPSEKLRVHSAEKQVCSEEPGVQAGSRDTGVDPASWGPPKPESLPPPDPASPTALLSLPALHTGSSLSLRRDGRQPLSSSGLLSTSHLHTGTSTPVGPCPPSVHSRSLHIACHHLALLSISPSPAHQLGPCASTRAWHTAGIQ